MGPLLVRNILLFVLDQLSARALSLYGGPFSSHVLTTMAEDGVLVEDVHCAFPLCQPSRASLWSGQLPHRNRVWSNGRKCPVTPLDADRPALGRLFSGNGWEARHFGKKHDAGALQGFTCGDESGRLHVEDTDPRFPFTDDTYADAYTVSDAISYLDGRDDERPLFMVVDLINPHNICAWVGLNRDCVKVPVRDDELVPLPPNFDFDDIASRPLPVQYLCCSHVRQSQVAGWSRRDYSCYLAAYRFYLDRALADVSRVLDAWKAKGLMTDESLVILTSDHGDNLTARGSVTKQVTLYEEPTRVPLIISGPGVKAKGTRLGGLYSLIDLFPTVASLAHLPLPANLDGLDFSRAVDGCDVPSHDIVSSEWYTEWGYTISPGRMIRCGKWKYIRYLEGDGEELYDLETDPYETRNLAATDSQDLVRLRSVFDAYLARTGDPFLSLKVQVDPRWRSHSLGYHKHTGPAAPEA